jgi:hypothetical protein
MAVKEDFKQYSGGVYRNATAKVSGAHAVKVVGFGYEKQTTADDPLDDWYWIVANSWGTRWGDGGNFKISMSERIAYLASSLKPTLPGVSADDILEITTKMHEEYA